MIERRKVFWKVLTLFTSLILVIFIWEAISPLGFDVNYAVSKNLSQEFVVNIDTSVPDLNFIDKPHLFAYLMDAWDSIKTPLPKEAIHVSTKLRTIFSGERYYDIFPKTRAPGLSFRSYSGVKLLGLPQKISPNESLENFNLSRPIHIITPNTSYEWSGFIEIGQDGEYLFSLASDDGSFLFIDNILRVNNGGGHAVVEKEAKFYLTKGIHPISLKYFNGNSGGYLNLRWAYLDGTQPTSLGWIPANLFSNSGSLAGLEFRSKGYFLDFEQEEGPTIFNLESSGQTLVEKSYSDIHKLLNVEIVSREIDGEYHLASRTNFIRPSYGSNLLFSIISSIAICSGLLAITYYIIRNKRPETKLFSINCFNCIVIGFLSRFNNLGTVPGFRYTYDEFTAWGGLNLIAKGKPSAWVWPQYSKTHEWVKYIGDPVSIGEYQFHPPPFYSLIVGAWLKILGATTIYQFPIFLARVPSLCIAVATILTLLYLLNKLYGREVSILGSLFFSLLPLSVTLGSLVKADNLIGLISLLVMLILLNQSFTRVRRAGLLVICMLLAVLTKEVGVFIPLAVFLYSFQQRNFFDVFWAIFGGLLGILSFLLYAYFLNWEEFLFTMNNMEGDGCSLDVFKQLMFHQEVYQTTPILLLSWIGLFLFVKRSQNIFLVFVFSYLFAYCMLSVGGLYYPWHYFILFPFLSLGFGQCVKQCLLRPTNRSSKLVQAIGLVLIVIPLVSIECQAWVNALTTQNKRVLLTLVGIAVLATALYLNRIPKVLYPLYCFIVLSLAYFPFVYVLIFKNYI